MKLAQYAIRDAALSGEWRRAAAVLAYEFGVTLPDSYYLAHIGMQSALKLELYHGDTLYIWDSQIGFRRHTLGQINPKTSVYALSEFEDLS
jgi:hypothetical protein